MKTIRKARLIAVMPGSKGHHEVRVGCDGVVYCTCRGWVASRNVPKACKHLQRFMVDNDAIRNATTTSQDGKYILD